jgi:hypothetical protein
LMWLEVRPLAEMLDDLRVDRATALSDLGAITAVGLALGLAAAFARGIRGNLCVDVVAALSALVTPSAPRPLPRLAATLYCDCDLMTGRDLAVQQKHIAVLTLIDAVAEERRAKAEAELMAMLEGEATVSEEHAEKARKKKAKKKRQQEQKKSNAGGRSGKMERT